MDSYASLAQVSLKTKQYLLLIGLKTRLPLVQKIWQKSGHAGVSFTVIFSLFPLWMEPLD